MSSSAESASAGGKESPLWKTIRDQLIEKIRSGEYGEGVPLPSISEMTIEWSVSTTTARKVLSELAVAGYAESKGTRGYFARTPDPGAKPQPSTGTREEPARGVLSVRATRILPVGETLSADATSAELREDAPSAEAALALRVQDPSSSIVVRRTLSRDERGTPVELRTDYFNSAIVPRTPAGGAHELPVEPEAFEAYAGRRMTWGRRHVAARHPTDTEAAALGLIPAAVVLVRVGVVIDETGTPVAYSESVWPAEGMRLDLGEG